MGKKGEERRGEKAGERSVGRERRVIREN